MSTEEQNREFREAKEHRDMLLDLRFILSTDPGKRFFKYLFRSYDVAQSPPEGLNGEFLHDRLGFMRAGNAIFKVASEADFETAAKLLAQIEKERYEEIYNATNGSN